MEALIIIAAIILIGLALLVIPRWRIKRAIPQVIKMFREQNAVGIKNAKTEEELGFKQRTMLEGMFMPRDFKPHALTALIQAEIIQMTEDGKLYLSEDKLIDSGLYKPESYIH
jgi:hypothetical protein